MTDQSSSLVDTRGIVPAWGDVARFAIRPRLPQSMSGISPASLLATIKLYALDMVLMGIALLVFVAIEGAGFDLPSNELESIDLGPGMIAFIVLFAPIGEEIAFRGWLSGRPGALAAIALLALALAIGNLFDQSFGAATTVFLVTGCIVLALGSAYVLRDRPAFRWFARLFPLFFWLSTLGFAAIHLGNYADTEQMLVSLTAARLDGDVVDVGDAWMPSDAVETTEIRAGSLRLLAPDALTVSLVSAAWVHGAVNDPPARLTLCRTGNARLHHVFDRRIVVHDRGVDRVDRRRYAGVWVTTPARTLADLARADDEHVRGVTATLARLHPDAIPEALQWFAARGRMPHRRRATALLERLAEALLTTR